MAITIIKKPAEFFNCTSPAIFEFTTDTVIGNFDNYVADIFINSKYTSKTAVVKNIFPNTKTKIFSVDVSEFLKSLQLNNFNFEFNGTKNFGIEKFNLDIKIRDGSIPDASLFNFDDYYFDNFIFTDGLSVVDTNLQSGFYSILGEKLLFDKIYNIDKTKNTFINLEAIEVCSGFDNFVAVFVNERLNNTIQVKGVSLLMPNTKGISYALLNDLQINSIIGLTEITTNNQSTKKLFAIPFNGIHNKIVQLRFFNSKGGFSFFYAEIKSDKENRSKVDFYENNYFNENENRSGVAQSKSDYKNTIDFSGIKNIKLKELFSELLRSPKIEINLKKINENDFFIECEVVGSSADQYTHFDYKLTANINNSGNFKL